MKSHKIYLRSFIFGVEDSLVSTTGLLSGIAAVNTPRHDILLAGIVLIFVEALSMGIGIFLSEQSTEELMGGKQNKAETIFAGVVMFISYFVSGFIPLAPYLLLSTSAALSVSIILALISLFLLGTLSAKLYNKNTTKSALRMLLLGGLAVIVGVLVGNFANSLI